MQVRWLTKVGLLRLFGVRILHSAATPVLFWSYLEGNLFRNGAKSPPLENGLRVQPL
jgi:hypothetical protein